MNFIEVFNEDCDDFSALYVDGKKHMEGMNIDTNRIIKESKKLGKEVTYTEKYLTEEMCEEYLGVPLPEDISELDLEDGGELPFPDFF